jgi:hypothetical protein
VKRVHINIVVVSPNDTHTTATMWLLKHIDDDIDVSKDSWVHTLKPGDIIITNHPDDTVAIFKLPVNIKTDNMLSLSRQERQTKMTKKQVEPSTAPIERYEKYMHLNSSYDIASTRGYRNGLRYAPRLNDEDLKLEASFSSTYIINAMKDVTVPSQYTAKKAYRLGYVLGCLRGLDLYDPTNLEQQKRLDDIILPYKI